MSKKREVKKGLTNTTVCIQNGDQGIRQGRGDQGIRKEGLCKLLTVYAEGKRVGVVGKVVCTKWAPAASTWVNLVVKLLRGSNVCIASTLAQYLSKLGMQRHCHNEARIKRLTILHDIDLWDEVAE